MALATSLQSKLAERDRLTEEIVTDAKEEFGAMIAGIFEKYPELENFAWLQYSHEYDDGESPWNIFTNVEVDDDYGGVHFYANATGKYRDNTPRSSEVFQLWKDFPEWLLLELFGEDNYIVCYPDRVETYGYHGGY